MSVLISLLTDQAINGEILSLQISESDAKNLLINETNNAIEKGVFGVTTIIIDDNLFWGNDQMDHIELLLDGKDPLDKAKLNEEERPRAIDRKAFKKQSKE